MSIKNKLEDAVKDIELANSLNNDTEKIIKRISNIGFEDDKQRMLKRITEPKPEHFSDKQWQEWKRIGLGLLNT